MNVTVGLVCLFSDFNIGQSINERLFVFFFSFLFFFCLIQVANETKTGNRMSKIFILQLFEMFDCAWNSSKVLFAQTNQVKWLHQLPIATIGRSFFSFFFFSQKSKRKRRRSKKFLFFEEKRCQKTLPKRISSEMRPIQLKWSSL